VSCQSDGGIANAALAVRVGLSESACLRRVKLLEQSGVIERTPRSSIRCWSASA